MPVECVLIETKPPGLLGPLPPSLHLPGECQTLLQEEGAAQTAARGAFGDSAGSGSVYEPPKWL